MRLPRGVAVAGLLLFGTITSLAVKLAYETECDNPHNEPKFFRRPLFMVFCMFVGMALMLPLSLLESCAARMAGATDEEMLRAHEPLLGSHREDKDSGVVAECRQSLRVLLPTLCDLAATALANVGLLYITVSSSSMLKMTLMLFTTFVSAVVLRRPLNRWHSLGIAACLAGAVLVGASDVLSQEDGSAYSSQAQQIALGISLTLASKAIQAAQLMCEDHYMRDIDIPTIRIVGYEGLFGAALMAGAVLPAAQLAPSRDGSGLHEDTAETLQMLAATPGLCALLGVYMAAVVGLNTCSLAVTGWMGATSASVLQAVCVALVWGTMLALRAALPGSDGPGEAWHKWSALQGAGFVLLAAAALLYIRGDKEDELLTVAFCRSDSSWGPPEDSALPTTTAPPAVRLRSSEGGGPHSPASAPFGSPPTPAFGPCSRPDGAASGLLFTQRSASFSPAEASDEVLSPPPERMRKSGSGSGSGRLGRSRPLNQPDPEPSWDPASSLRQPSTLLQGGVTGATSTQG